MTACGLLKVKDPVEVEIWQVDSYALYREFSKPAPGYNEIIFTDPKAWVILKEFRALHKDDLTRLLKRATGVGK